MAALHTQRPQVTTQDGLKLKLSNYKQRMVGRHIPGRHFSLTKASHLNLVCLFSFWICDNTPLGCHISFSGPLSTGTTRRGGGGGATSPLAVTVFLFVVDC